MPEGGTSRRRATTGRGAQPIIGKFDSIPAGPCDNGPIA